MSFYKRWRRQSQGDNFRNERLDETLEKSLSINASMQSMISLLGSEEGMPMDNILELNEELATTLNLVIKVVETTYQERNDIKEQVDRLREELSSGAEQRKQLQRELRECRQQLRKKGEGVQIEENSDFQALQLDFEEAQTLIRELDEQVYAKTQIIEVMEKEGAEKTGGIPFHVHEKTLNDLNNAKEFLEDLDEELAEKDYAVKAKQKELDEANACIDQLHFELEEKKTMIEVLRNQKGNNDVDASQEALQERETTRKTKLELEEALVLIEEQENDLTQKKEEIVSLEERLEAKNTELDLIRLRMEKIEQQEKEGIADNTAAPIKSYKITDSDIESVKSSITDDDSEDSSTLSSAARLKDEMKDALKLMEEQEISIAEKEEMIAKLEMRLEKALSSRSSEDSVELQRTKDDLEVAKTLIEEMDHDLHRKDKVIDELDVQIDRLQKQLENKDVNKSKDTDEDIIIGDFDRSKDLEIASLEISLKEMADELEAARQQVSHEQRKTLSKSTQAEAKLKEKDDVIKSMQGVIEGLHKDIEAFKKAQKRRELGGKSDDTQGSFFKRVRRVGTMIENYDVVKEELDKVKEELEQCKETLRKKELQEDMLFDQLEEKQNIIASLKQNELNIQKKKSKDEIKLQSLLLNKIETVQSDLDVANNVLGKKDGTVTSIEDSQSIGKEENDDQLTNATKNDEMSDIRKTRLLALQRELEETKSLLTARTQEMSSLTESLEQTKVALEKKEANEAMWFEQLREMQEELLSLKPIQTKAKDIVDYEEMIQNLEQQVNDAKLLLRDMHDNFEIQSKEVEEKDARIRDLEAKLQQVSFSMDNSMRDSTMTSAKVEELNNLSQSAAEQSVEEAVEETEASIEKIDSDFMKFQMELEAKDLKAKIESLETELEDVNSKLLDLQTYSDSLSSELDESNSIIIQHQGTIQKLENERKEAGDELQKELTSLREMLKSSKSELASKSGSLEELQEEVKVKSEELDTLRKYLLESDKSLEEEFERMESELASKDSEQIALREELRVKSEELESLRKYLLESDKSLEEEFQRMESELTGWQKEKAILQEDIKLKSDEVESKAKELEEYKRRQAINENEVLSIRKKLERMDANLQRLGSELITKQEEEVMLREELRTKSLEITALKVQEEDFQSVEREQLIRSNKILEDDLREMESDLAAYKQEVLSLKNNLMVKSDDFQAMKLTLLTSKGELKVMQNMLAENEKEREFIQDALESKSKEFEVLRADLAESNASLKGEIEMMESKLILKEKEKEQLRKQNNLISDELESVRRNIDEANRSLEEQLEVMESNFARNEEEKASLNEECQALQGELTRLNTTLSAAHNALDEREERIQIASAERENSKELIQKLKSTLERKEEENDELTKLLNDSKNIIIEKEKEAESHVKQLAVRLDKIESLGIEFEQASSSMQEKNRLSEKLLSENEMSISLLESEVQKMKDRSELAEEEKQKALDNAERLESQVAELQSVLSDRDQEKERLQEEVYCISNELELIKQRLKKADEDTDTVKLNELQQQLLEAQSIQRVDEAAFQKLSQELEESKRDVAIKEAESSDLIASLKEKVEENESVIQSLEGFIKKQVSSKANWDKQETPSDIHAGLDPHSPNDDMVALLRQKDSELQSLKELMEKSDKTIDALKKQLKIASDEADNYEMKLRDVDEALAKKDAQIKALDHARKQSRKTIQTLRLPVEPTSKRNRRYRGSNQNDSMPGFENYMEPFVSDVSKAQAQFDKAKKNLRLAIARERLIRPFN